jgi:hypothetical protein
VIEVRCNDTCHENGGKVIVPAQAGLNELMELLYCCLGEVLSQERIDPGVDKLVVRIGEAIGAIHLLISMWERIEFGI